MKKQIIGARRFSKIERTKIEERDNLEDAFRAAGRPQADGSVVIGYTLAERLQMLENNAKKVLKAAGLPDQVVVIEGRDLTDIDFYVQRRGYQHDTPEGLAAEILIQSDRARRSKTEEPKLTAVFRLGELRTYAKVYGIESLVAKQSGKTGGKSKTGSKAPMTRVIEEMNREVPSCKYTSILAEMEADVDGSEGGLLSDLRERGLVTVVIQSVDSEKVRYVERQGGKEKTLSIRSLQNALSNAKNKT